MLLTQLHYFEALAREQHFGRAAASCYVTTSTLSEAIRKLEGELKVPLVNRGRSTFRGLTPEGELVLEYARRIVGDHRRLLEDLSAGRGSLETTVRFGVIPSGVYRGAAVLSELREAHPAVSVDLVAGLRSEEIIDRLHAAELDAGVIHPASGEGGGLHLTELGTVDFVVLAAPELLDHLDGATSVSGEQLVDLPLAVLSPGMRARAEFDRAMASADLAAEVVPAADADSVEALIALASTRRWAVVVPANAPGVVASELQVLDLVEPAVKVPVVLARLETRPTSALATALDEAAAATR
ncbi:MAG: LysR family transcriptional regulator [Mycobacteriaceae bacterium]|uniref:LysR family transcriptional regulator n=1 Tax=Corynebacterium sp. TaxID=1720 RepID=UPI003F9BAB91